MIKIGKVISIASLAMTLAVAVTPTVAYAASTDEYASNTLNPDTNSNEIDSKQLTSDQIHEVDQFITVKNNQFVMLNNNLNANTKETVIQNLNSINNEIKEKNYSINPETKEIEENSVLTKSYGHEIRYYWWGNRHIFRTNAAIYGFINDLDTASVGSGLLALFPDLTVGAGITTAYLQKLVSDLNYNQSIHSKDKIYLDINHALVYTIGVWHD